MVEFSQETFDLLNEQDTTSSGRPQSSSDTAIEEAYTNLSFRIIYQSYNYFVPQIKDMIEKREVWNLRPEYQRRLRWSAMQKSLLIESLLLNIPIPPVFLYESDLARYEVMDGQQRLNAVHDFVINNYPLTGLEKLNFLNGKRYNALPPKLKRGLDRSSISAIVLLQETRADLSDPYLVRRYVFERLNTGGRPLNHQEIRNSIYRGKFNDEIVELARDKNFCKIFGIPEYTETDQSDYYENPERQENNLYRTMGDCQIVLRFFALMNEQNISGSMRNMLDKCMQKHKSDTDDQVTEYVALYKRLLAASVSIFKENVFCLPPDDKGKRRVSVPIYDAVMVSLYRRISDLDKFVEQGAKVKEHIEALIADKEKRELLTGKANTASSIKDRLNAFTAILAQICPTS